MRYTGLRISDASLLTPNRFDGKRISLYQAKTKEWVFVPIPPILQNALKQTPLRGGYYFLRGESTKLETMTDLWRRVLRKAFRQCRNREWPSAPFPRYLRDRAAHRQASSGIARNRFAPTRAFFHQDHRAALSTIRESASDAT
jgi:integrase